MADRLYDRVKRVLDIVGAGFGLLFLWPVFLIVAALIKSDSRGHIFYQQERVGLGGDGFMMVKFRTMVRDADKDGPSVTHSDDPRVTRVGRLLRLTKVDELPNLWNVLVGEMSLVGPRPELPEHVSRFDEDEKRVLSVRPGITGPTQIRYIAEEEMLSPVNVDENYATSVLRDKLKWDLDYIDNRGFFRDIVILITTCFAIGFKLLGRYSKVLEEPTD
ncbi:MAG: sugar transferase [Candidatus Coatesbacteria bacterium]|nr:MAG: sugar transferase [Candidatus Coatesbacteria bacterium]